MGFPVQSVWAFGDVRFVPRETRPGKLSRLFLVLLQDDSFFLFSVK